MVGQRGGFTIDHVLHRIYAYCDRFVTAKIIERKHNQLTITFHPFPTPAALEGQLPEGCPGWRLYVPQDPKRSYTSARDTVCMKCPHQKACFSAQVMQKDKRITQMDYYEYRREKEKRKSLDNMFRQYAREKYRNGAHRTQKAKEKD
jgi:hypothetical protein